MKKYFFILIYSSKLEYEIYYGLTQTLSIITKKKQKYTLFQIIYFIIYYY